MNTSCVTGMLRAAAVAALLTLAATSATAGKSCEDQPPSVETTQKALQLGHAVHKRLEQSGATLALIGRAGQDLTQYGVRYSHFGFVWRDHPDGRWMVIHQLNHCGTATSSIYNQGLGTFFLDDLWRMEAVVLVPDPAAQDRIVDVLRTNRHLDLHSARYNMLAYPFSTRYQNSNQWALEVLAMAESRDTRIMTRQQSQQWLRLVGYQPSEIRLDAMTRLGARMTRANVAFDDHPGELRWSDRIRTVTVDSVFAFLRARDANAVLIEVDANRMADVATPSSSRLGPAD